MSYDNGRSQLPLHGYQPVIIDEDCLADEEYSEAMREVARTIGMGCGCDWKTVLSPAELRKLEDVPKYSSPFFVGGVSPEREEKQFELARLGKVRTYARRKYSQSRRIWYGDGLPFERS